MDTVLSPLTEELSGLAGQSATALGSAALAFMLIFSVISCFFGFRLRKVCITLIGFLIGLVCGLLVGFWLLPDTLAVVVLIGLALGALLGFLAYRMYRVGIFLWMGVSAFGVSYSLLMQWFPQDNAALGIVAVVLAALIGIAIGLLALRFLRPVIILTTAISGGFNGAMYLLTIGAGLFHYDMTAGLPAILTLIGGAALALFGMIVQFRTTPKRG